MWAIEQTINRYFIIFVIAYQENAFKTTECTGFCF